MPAHVESVLRIEWECDECHEKVTTDGELPDGWRDLIFCWSDEGRYGSYDYEAGDKLSIPTHIAIKIFSSEVCARSYIGLELAHMWK